MNKNVHEQRMLVIRTARTEKEINQAARNGFYPLVKRVSPSPEIRSKYAVYQNPESGEVQVVGDYRSAGEGNEVIGFTYYYPHSFPSPFAAYLIPPDIKVGEVVILEDLIEDVVSGRWNQGDVFRLASCRATWNGNDFILQHSASSEEVLLG
jgi:hypothetical protein